MLYMLYVYALTYMLYMLCCVYAIRICCICYTYMLYAATLPLTWANGGKGPAGWVDTTYLDAGIDGMCSVEIECVLYR